jgi:hypothetical protein
MRILSRSIFAAAGLGLSFPPPLEALCVPPSIQDQLLIDPSPQHPPPPRSHLTPLSPLDQPTKSASPPPPPYPPPRPARSTSPSARQVHSNGLVSESGRKWPARIFSSCTRMETTMLRSARGMAIRAMSSQFLIVLCLLGLSCWRAQGLVVVL